jgi:hypothetical protein
MREPMSLRSSAANAGRAALCGLLAALAAGCGGGGALDNAPSVANAEGVTGQKLSFAYFQRCVNPVLNTALAVPGSGTTNTCSAGGCHDNTSGTGGALRLLGGAAAADPAAPADAVRASDIYKNYYSSLGETVVGAPDQSRLLNKPLVRGVLHGGGLIFASADDAAARTIRYWINRPMPQGQDEFSTAAATMFTPADPVTGACNTE